MFRQIFLLLLFLFVCSQLCGQGLAARNQQPPVSAGADGNTMADFFPKPGQQIEKLLKSEGTGEESENFIVEKIESVFIAAADGVMVALAEAIKNGQNDKISFLAKFCETTEKNTWGEKAIKNEGEWKIQLAAKEIGNTKTDTVIKSVAIVAKEKKIYHITVSNNSFNGEPSESPSSAQWHVRVVEGTVEDKGKAVDGSKTEKTIKWETPTFSPIEENSELKEKLNIQHKTLPLCDSFAFVIGKEKKNIYFVMKCKAADSTDKNITAVFQLEESVVHKKELKLSYADNSEDCFPLFFQWEGDIYKAPTVDSKCNNKELMVFNAGSNSFIQSKSPIAGLRDFLKDKNNFATATIGEGNNNNVLLFTQEKEVDATKRNVHLWMTDSKRVSLAGSFVIEAKEALYMSIVYTNGELFALHQQYQEGGKKDDNKFTLRRLKEQLENITNILEAWEKDDDNIKQPCKNTDNKLKSVCTPPLPAAGLVGFLHNKFNEETKEWKDEYYYTNATVENGQMLSNGLTFSGKGAGAQWPIGKKQKEDQPYSFINPGFTLVATVNISESTNSKENSIFGVGFEDTQKNFGLWCTADGEWSVKKWLAQTKVQTSSVECKHGKIYYLTLILKGAKISAYVNEKQIIDSGANEISIENLKYFYFGTDINVQNKKKEVESHIIVLNVFLYNRPFEDNEIDNLKKYVKPADDIKTFDEAVGTNTAGGSSDEQPTPLPPDPNEDEKKEAPSPSRTEDGGVGGGVRVFSLLLAALCVSAPLLHL